MQPPTSEAPAEMFTGDAWWDVIYQGQEPSQARANMVRFAPGARTAWHSHALGQTLFIVAGVALIQSRGERLIEAHPGDIVHTPPGEEHWHGAAPEHFHWSTWRCGRAMRPPGWSTSATPSTGRPAPSLRG
ncbi:cupin domain-containing protein [Nonomuraea turkmeniaca]|uniref:cupin domain-containing protein n=1 Tax=Nonomuraea turkmeniaca TaxID=103838 RepID=UPI001FE80740|nr:cupin domain-containing protein [Nonomuraea turkmeniaca]